MRELGENVRESKWSRTMNEDMEVTEVKGYTGHCRKKSEWLKSVG